MKPLLRITAAAIALCAASPAAWALTAEEAWEAWVGIAADYGETVTASGTAKSGSTLTASGVAVAMEMDEMTLSGTLGDVTLTENGDGTVAIAMPPEFAIDLTVAPEYGEKVEAVINIGVPNLALIATDANGGVSFTYNSPSMSFGLGELKVDGTTVPVNMSGTLTGNSGTYAKGAGDPASITSVFNAQMLEVSFDGRDPEGTGSGKGSLTMANITSASTGQGQMLFMDPEQIPALLKAGASLSGSTSVGATTFAVEGVDGSENFALSGDMDGGNATMSLDAAQVAYAITYTGFDVTVSGSEIPLPAVTVGLGETTMNVIFPLAQSAEPKPFMLAVALKDLTIADGIWNMIDPGTVLPRDPATVSFNLAGTGNWLIDILDPETMANPQGVPGELHALNLSDLLVKVAGAQFVANGAFTFNNADLMTFGGMPAPDGKLNATLTGGNALMDNLVKMGLMPADQANGIKLGAGMFARPGTGPDELTTEITVSPDGTVAANGIPIPIH